jgi:hypothetical protein
MNVNLTEKYIKCLNLNFENLLDLASRFVDEQEKAKNNGRYTNRSSRREEITVENYNNLIVWTYEYNSACHCHPEMRTERKEYPLKDFVKWVQDNKVELEQYSEEEYE